jgi:hypothetical protein
VISELLIEDRALNHDRIIENGWTNSVWDMVLYSTAAETSGLTIHLNTSVYDTVMRSTDTIDAVKARVLDAETELIVHGKIFIDCTGDGIVAERAGCEWRWGREGKNEFGEIHAPECPDDKIIGNSINFTAKDMGFPVPFTAPPWACRYDDASFFLIMEDGIHGCFRPASGG